MADLIMKDVSFEYPGGFLAVEHVNMEIRTGENVAIIGQNGAGKTTTVKMMNGLLKPTSGDIMIGKVNTKDRTTAQISRIVGYVFQNPDDQIFHSSVESEVRFGLKLTELSEEEQEKRTQEVLKITGMDMYKDENPFNLPLSVRKFVTIASVLAMDTEVLIFDEPTAGQDIKGNKRLADILEYLHGKGKTVITISHDMEFVAANFERVIVMANKKVIKSGTPQEIFWDFATLDHAMLKQPYVSRICHALNLGGNIISSDHAAKAIVEAMRNRSKGKGINESR